MTMTQIDLNPENLLNNDFGLCLAHGRLKTTVTNEDGTHLTLSFKNWKRGDRRRNVPIYEAERIYIEVPNQTGWGDKIGNVDLASGAFYTERSADPARVAAALRVIDAVQGREIVGRIQHPGFCMICSKELTDPISIDRGIGPDCYGNATGSQHQEKVKQTKAVHLSPVAPEPVAEKAPETDVKIAAKGNTLTVSIAFTENFNDVLSAVKSIDTNRRWNAADKVWEVKPTVASADVLRDLCKQYKYEVSDEAVALLKPVRANAETEATAATERAALSKADDADLDIEDFGFEPFPFQRAGIAYGDLCGDRYMIADEQGLGKTIQALGRIQVKQQFPAVIVVPSAVKVKWARACETAFGDTRTVATLEGQTTSKIDADVVIVNYDILSFWEDAIIEMAPKALILDESHYIKNRKAKRTGAAKAIAKAIPADGSVILLSGTPILNRPIELVEQLDVMGRLEDFGGFSGFVTSYVGWERNDFAGGNVPAKNGAMNLTQLNEKLRSTCFVRRLKKDVLAELPEKRRDVVPITLDGNAYSQAYTSARNNMLDNPGASHADQLAEIQSLRRAAAEGKLKGSIEWITDFLESGEKLVVFARHRDIQQRIHDAFPGSVRISGIQDQSKQARQDAMDSFQNDPEVKLAVVSMDAGREGIDLYAASNLAFVELGWNPGVHDQAEDRIHRIGQDRGTMMYYLLAEGTIDERMAELIESKRVVKDAATEGQEIIDQPESSMVGNLIEWLTEDE